MKSMLVGLIGSLLLLGSFSVNAGEDEGDSEALDRARESIESSLKGAFKEMKIRRIAESPIPGVYEVESNIPRTLYVSADGRYFVAGDIYEIADGRLINPAQERMQKVRVKALSNLADEDMVIFKSENTEPKTTITVFTDVDCGYCRKLHLEVDEMNALGIQVNYLAYPRAGLEGVTYQKMVDIWCADDPKVAMTRAKTGLTNPPAKTCEHPIAEEYELGNELGVQGTPAIILSDGQMIPGYLPAKELAKRLGIE